MELQIKSGRYAVVDQDGRFDVRDGSGRSILVCGDAASASHYATLLNSAYDAGYKDGFRAGTQVNDEQ